MAKPEQVTDLELIDGTWRLVRQAKAQDSTEAAPDPWGFVRIGLGLAVAVALRLWLFGPIHH